MLARVEEALAKTIRNFIWDENTPQIGLQYLYLPKNEEGIDLLDIKACNTTIQVTWLKWYLDLSRKWPIWAFLVDALINRIISPSIESLEQVNTFLQSWDIPTQGLRASKLPSYVLNMLKAVKDLKVHFAVIKLSKEMKNQMPIWYYLGLTLKNHKWQCSACIMSNHSLNKIVDLIQLAKHTKDPDSGNQRHYHIQTCTYDPCKEDQRKGCCNPNKCSHTAYDILQDMQSKYNPYEEPQVDDLILTHWQ